MGSPFSGELFEFLADLAANNNREWFNANKPRYEATVREPARAFIRAMADPLAEVSPYFLADDARAGGSLMRVYRDTRFAKDKTPYKTNVGIQFRHDAGKDVHAPGFYLHLSVEECFVGCGVWRPDSGSLGKIREKIDDEQGRWTGVLDGLGPFEQVGDSLKRPPRGFDKEHPLVDELKRKDHIVTVPLEADEIGKSDFVDVVAGWFAKSGDYVRFLCEAIEVPY